MGVREICCLQQAPRPVPKRADVAPQPSCVPRRVSRRHCVHCAPCRHVPVIQTRRAQVGPQRSRTLCRVSSSLHTQGVLYAECASLGTKIAKCRISSSLPLSYAACSISPLGSHTCSICCRQKGKLGEPAWCTLTKQVPGLDCVGVSSCSKHHRLLCYTKGCSHQDICSMCCRVVCAAAPEHPQTQEDAGLGPGGV